MTAAMDEPTVGHDVLDVLDDVFADTPTPGTP